MFGDTDHGAGRVKNRNEKKRKHNGVQTVMHDIPEGTERICDQKPLRQVREGHESFREMDLSGQKAMIAVSAIPMNRAPFTFSTISTILMISPINVKMTAGE